MFGLFLKNRIFYLDSEQQSLFHCLAGNIFIALKKIVFTLLIINTFSSSFSFKRLSIAKAVCSVCGFALLFFKKLVGTSYSKFQSKDGGEGRNVESAGRNPSSS